MSLTTFSRRKNFGMAVASLGMLVSVAILSVSAPAQAGRSAEEAASFVAVPDSIQDVREFEASDSWPQPITRAPSRRNGDIQRVEITYGSRNIEIAIEFRELRRPTTRAPKLILGGTFRTSARADREVYVMSSLKNPKGGGRLQDEPSCAVHHRVDYRRERALLRVPTGCLESPRWVQFQATAVVQRRTQVGRTFGADVAPGARLSSDRYSARAYRP